MRSHAKTLLIGYGNTLREDDGFGVKVVTLLEGLCEADFIQNYQLVPEMCQQFADYNNIIFVDVNIECDAGVFAVPLQSSLDPFGHAVTPWQLVALSRELFGFDGDFLIFSVGGYSFGYKEELSDLISSKAKILAEYLKRFINQI